MLSLKRCFAFLNTDTVFNFHYLFLAPPQGFFFCLHLDVIGAGRAGKVPVPIHGERRSLVP